MNIVVDANVLISSLIKHGKSAEMLLSPFFNVLIPEFVFTEFRKHKTDILEKTHRSSEEFWSTYTQIKEMATIVSKAELEEYLEEAERICPDPDDVMYFALALKMGCGIWSNDKRLKEQEGIKVYSTEDLAKEFDV